MLLGLFMNLSTAIHPPKKVAYSFFELMDCSICSAASHGHVARCQCPASFQAMVIPLLQKCAEAAEDEDSAYCHKTAAQTALLSLQVLIHTHAFP